MATQVMCWLPFVALAVFGLSSEDTSQNDGSICLKNCSGHGKCRNYMCNCDLGFHGETCDVFYHNINHEVVPILSAGHRNITSMKKLNKYMKKHDVIVMGYSRPSCAKCIGVEPYYKNLSQGLRKLRVPFFRVNTDKPSVSAFSHSS